ncbi:MAG: hypothetical protein QW815_05970 [Nitrososphaerota archaeon]
MWSPYTAILYQGLVVVTGLAWRDGWKTPAHRLGGAGRVMETAPKWTSQASERGVRRFYIDVHKKRRRSHM